MIDLVATWPHYRAHAEPVWAALPAEIRGPGDAALVASWADHRLARRQGYRRIVVMEHGIGQSYGTASPGYPGGARREADLFLAPNGHAAARWRAAYPRTPVELIGSPRIESLPAREPGPGLVVAVTMHWGSMIAPEAKPALPWYARVLPELARRFTVIGHGHPKAAAAASFWRRLGIEYIADFDEVCRRADLYVADNTSTLFEFASTGRPVLLLNAPWYRPEAHHGLRFWEAAEVGINVWEPAELLPAVERALLDREEQQERREAALHIVYAFRHGAAARAAAVIASFLAERSSVAA